MYSKLSPVSSSRYTKKKKNVHVFIKTSAGSCFADIEWQMMKHSIAHRGWHKGIIEYHSRAMASGCCVTNADSAAPPYWCRTVHALDWPRAEQRRTWLARDFFLQRWRWSPPNKPQWIRMHRASDIRSISRSLGCNCLLLSIQFPTEIPTRIQMNASGGPYRYIYIYMYVKLFTNLVNLRVDRGESTWSGAWGVGRIHGYM